MYVCKWLSTRYATSNHELVTDNSTDADTKIEDIFCVTFVLTSFKSCKQILFHRSDVLVLFIHVSHIVCCVLFGFFPFFFFNKRQFPSTSFELSMNSSRYYDHTQTFAPSKKVSTRQQRGKNKHYSPTPFKGIDVFIRWVSGIVLRKIVFKHLPLKDIYLTCIHGDCRQGHRSLVILHEWNKKPINFKHM